MAPPIRTSRAKWIEAGLQALATGGPDAVRIDHLAASLGVSRGGFYGHFPNRGAFLEALLDAWEQAAINEVLEQVEQRGGDPRTKIRRAGALTFSDRLLPIDLAIRDWSRRDQAVARRLERVDNKRMAYLRSLFAEFCANPRDVEGRSVLAFALIIGSHFSAAEHGPYTRAQALGLAISQLLR